MKALTVRNPWAWAIAYAGKTVENRSWATKYRGRLYIHAGAARPTLEMLHDCEARVESIGGMFKPAKMPYGALVATAELVNCQRNGEPLNPWAEPDCYHWILRDIRVLRRPIPCKGALQLWNYDK